MVHSLQKCRKLVEIQAWKSSHCCRCRPSIPYKFAEARAHPVFTIGGTRSSWVRLVGRWVAMINAILAAFEFAVKGRDVPVNWVSRNLKVDLVCTWPLVKSFVGLLNAYDHGPLREANFRPRLPILHPWWLVQIPFKGFAEYCSINGFEQRC